MPYAARATRATPGCFLFIIDQSSSMTDPIEPDRSRADTVATIINRLLSELIAECSVGEGVRHYFDVGIIGYGMHGPQNGLVGPLAASILNPITMLAEHPTRMEMRKRKQSDGVGGLVEVETQFAVWFDPVANGGTPMAEALTLAAETLLDWCEAHPASFPPVVMHLTDGEPNTNPEEVAQHLRRISTDDGQTIFMNIHVSGGNREPIVFPDSDASLPGESARLLYRMSSLLVGPLIEKAKGVGFDVNPEARAFMYNADTERVIQFFEIGTLRPENMR